MVTEKKGDYTLLNVYLVKGLIFGAGLCIEIDHGIESQLQKVSGISQFLDLQFKSNWNVYILQIQFNRLVGFHQKSFSF